MIMTEEFKRELERRKKEKENKPVNNINADIGTKSGDSNNYNDIIAYIHKGGFKQVGAEWTLVKEGITSSVKIYESGFRFSMPWVKNTLISATIIKADIRTPLLNTADNIQIEPIPVVDFVIEDFDKFYRVFCSSKSNGVITKNESDLKLLHSDVRDAVRTVVNNCKFEVVKQFFYRNGYYNLPDSELNLKERLDDIIFDIYDKYGVSIVKLSWEDTNLPVKNQDKYDEKARQDIDNEIIKSKAEAEAEAKKKIAEANAAELELILEKLSVLPPEQRASIINTMYLPKGTININGSGDADLRNAAAAAFLANSNFSTSASVDNSQPDYPKKTR